MKSIMRTDLKRLVMLAIFSLAGAGAHAEVLDKSASGFTMQSSVRVQQSPVQAWQQFLNIADWWDAEHSWFGEAKNFSITARAGGCFCEIDGARQVEHMRVVFVEPEKEIRLLGGLGPLQAMAVHGAMSWKFDALPNGGTEIVHQYAVSGYLPGGLDQLAEVVDAVQTSQLQRLQASLQVE